MPAEHALDTVSPFVAALVIFDRCLLLLPAWNASAYALVLQGFSEPVGVVASASEQPCHVWQTAQQSSRADVITDLPSGDEQVQRPTLAVADGVQLGVHTALGATDQSITSPSAKDGGNGSPATPERYSC